MTEVTVLICTREILQSMTLQAITAAKANTKVPFDLVVLETKDFTHPRDINKVLKFVKTKYFVTMDDDILPEKNWLEEMIKVAESDERIGAVQANIRTPEGIIFIWHGEANPYSREPTKVEEIGFACTALALFKTKIVREVGYFDENFYKWSFDTDYSWRIKEKGYKVVVAPKARAIHYASYTISQNPQLKEKYEILDRTYLVKKWILTKRFKDEYAVNNPTFIDYWRRYCERIETNE